MNISLRLLAWLSQPRPALTAGKSLTLFGNSCHGLHSGGHTQGKFILSAIASVIPAKAGIQELQYHDIQNYRHPWLLDSGILAGMTSISLIEI